MSANGACELHVWCKFLPLVPICMGTMRVLPIAALLPLLIGATCDGPRPDPELPVAPITVGWDAPVLEAPPRIWVLVERTTGPQSAPPRPVVFARRQVGTLYIRMSSGREVALITVPEELVSADLGRLSGRDALRQLRPSAGVLVGPFRGTIPSNPVIHYDRYVEADDVQRLVLLLDTDDTPKESMELAAAVTIDTTTGMETIGSATFVPLAHVFGVPTEPANAPAPTAPPVPSSPPPCPLDSTWVTEGEEWRLESPVRFEIDSPRLTEATVAALRTAVDELAPETRLTAFVDIHPSVAAHYAERSMNLPRRRADALAQLLGARATTQVRLVSTERSSGPPTIRFALDCVR